MYPFEAEAPRPRRARNLATTAGLVAAAATAGSLATEPDGRWYRDLDKPSWQPPPVAFPIVWTTLYADIAVTAAAVLNELDRRGETEQAADFRKALAGNLALNGGWSWLFFRGHNLPASTLGAGVLALNSLRLVRRAGRVDRRFALALAPYAAWTAFATVLAGVVWSLNADRE
ncbi:MAG TPA: TspO/MBR family protein [Propionicimonas sp.]|jgi:tryptophan-rich sensory protein|uniref:TspO/MBR family protein n=1 Tax=Propionicimonas sp. TaxID=1955623 RepID=UPI002F3FC809